MNENRITVLGGGLAGCLMSVLLRRRGYDVDLIEARADPRSREVYGGRSINLALSLRGLRALDRAGLAESALRMSIPMRGRQIHALDGSQVFQPYSANESEYINSISREGLNILLLDRAESVGVNVEFNQRCRDVDFETRTLHLETVDGESQETRKVNRIIAADGAGSAVRTAMVEAGHAFSSSEFLDHAYLELTIPSDSAGRHMLQPVEALHIWPRKSFMLIALPNMDGSYTCTLFLARDGEPSFESIRSDSELIAFFGDQFGDVVNLMPRLLMDYRQNPVSSLGTVRCDRWNVGDFSLLIGDAAHAIVPFYGQGMNCAFEDCLVLDEMADEEGWAWGTVFPEFSRTRRTDTDAIADLALLNFLEMRDKVADDRFMLKKQLEHELARRFPDLYVPVYSHVTFSSIPYSLAHKFGQSQALALDKFLDGTSSIDDIDWEKAETMVRNLSRSQMTEMETSTTITARNGE